MEVLAEKPVVAALPKIHNSYINAFITRASQKQDTRVDDDDEIDTVALENFRSNCYAILACSCYVICSVAMVLTNKAISSAGSEIERFPNLSVVLFQCISAVVLVEAAKYFKMIEPFSFSVDLLIALLPLSLFYVCMLGTGFFAMAYCSVPIVTIFKNLTNVLIVMGDVYFFGEYISDVAMFAVLAMAFGAIMLGFNDLDYNAKGYFYMTLNCLFTAGYTLYTRNACKNVKTTKFGMIFINNAISAAVLLPLVIYFGEAESISNNMEIISTPSFIAFNCLAGIVGILLSGSVLWCMTVTSATTVAVVGSMNKVPIAILGYLLFPKGAKTTYYGVVFMGLSIAGGLVYANAKLYAHPSKDNNFKSTINTVEGGKNTNSPLSLANCNGLCRNGAGHSSSSA